MSRGACCQSSSSVFVKRRGAYKCVCQEEPIVRVLQVLLPLRNSTIKGSLLGLPLNPDVSALPFALHDSPKYGGRA